MQLKYQCGGLHRFLLLNLFMMWQLTFQFPVLIQRAQSAAGGAERTLAGVRPLKLCPGEAETLHCIAVSSVERNTVLLCYCDSVTWS